MSVELGSVSGNGHRDLTAEIAKQEAEIEAGILYRDPTGRAKFVTNRHGALYYGWITE